MAGRFDPTAVAHALKQEAAARGINVVVNQISRHSGRDVFCPVHSTRRRLPLGAGSILGVYVTVLVTTSRMCRTLGRDDLCFLASANRAFKAASQSKTECTDRALNGDLTVLALIGESKLEMAGLGGSLRLGKEAAPVGGADMGAEDG